MVTLRINDFAAADTDGLLPLHITFGLEGVDRSDVSRFEGTYYGDIIWDTDFSMSPTESQEYLWSVCQDLQNSSMVYGAPNSENVICPIEDFKGYLQSINESFPYEADDDDDLSFGEMWYAFLESDEGGDTNVHRLSYVEEDGSDYVVRFYAMFIETTVSGFSASESTKKALRDYFDDEIDRIQANCPDDLCGSMGNAAGGGFCQCGWSDLETQDAFASSAIQGMHH